MAVAPSAAAIKYQMQHIHDNAIPSEIAASAAACSLALIAVVLRFLSRRVARVKYEWDDWLAVSGLVFLIASMIMDTKIIHYGTGRHSILITNPEQFTKYLVAAECLYQPALVSIKASILYLYYRVFFVSRAFVITLWLVGVFVFCYSLPQIFCAIFQCIPIAAQWDPTVRVSYCINIGLAATILAALNVLTDFILLILPMPLLYKLQMPTSQKYQIMGTFLLGGFVTFASIYRCISLHNIGPQDPAWDEVPVYIWTQLELGLGLVSACLPTLRPLFSNLPRLGSNSEQGGEKANASDQSLALRHERSNPAQSGTFEHLGVLGGDLEGGRGDGIGRAG